MTFEQDGAVRLDCAALSILNALRAIAAAQRPDQAGIRLFGVERLDRHLARDGVLGALAAAKLGADCRPVRAVLFDKTATTNWSLAWHQDLTIVVRKRHDTPGFGPWTVKAGMVHVAPPANVLSAMLTMRVHLDDVSETNAPLLIAPGSHALGRISEREIDAIVRRNGIATCLARAGDVWLYRTPILHASAAAVDPVRRRVVQIDFASFELPSELEWLGL